MKGQLNTLRLVYHPFSNQEGDWLWDDADVRQIMRGSKLYMIGQREEIFFQNQMVTDDGCLQFDLTCGGNRLEKVRLVLPAMLPSSERDCWTADTGKKIIRVLDKEGKAIRWFTPDKLLFEHWNKNAVVEGLERFRDLTVYDLHYVGISKKGDSFSRLFAEGHHKRVRILGNEWPIRVGARVADELFMFLFEIEDIGINVMSVPDANALVNPIHPDLGNVYADAEKAFIRIMDTKYNEVKYSSYPQGVDGLYGQGLDRYAYLIGEDITFATAQTTIRGATLAFGQDEDHGDIIGVQGDEALLLKFGSPPLGGISG